MPIRSSQFLLACFAIFLQVSLIHGEELPEYAPGYEERKSEVDHYVESLSFDSEEKALLKAIMSGKVEDLKKLRPVLDKKWSGFMADAAINSPSPDVPKYLREQGILKISDLWMSIIRGDEKGTADAILMLPKPPPVINGILQDALNWGSLAFTSNAPLRLAVRRGHAGIVKQLIDAGANVNEQLFKSDRPTPLCEAVSLGHTEIVKLLVDAGANLEVTDIDHGDSVMPLSLAIQSGRSKIVSILLEGGVQPDPYIYFAILKGNPDIVRALVKHGANVNALNAKGKTLLWVATAYNQGDIADILREAGAKMEADPINPPPDSATEAKSKDQ